MSSSDEFTVEKRHVSVPFASAIAILAAAFSAGGTYIAMRGDIAAGAAQSARIEAASIERDARMERRLEKLEETNFQTRDFMARIDERLAGMQRDVSDLKARRP